ncbi:uncharacterized protein LOC128667480 [Microplitis demolitor]|uniref:uncharacterized protein LOC128667480 n=1 Tax=Microplitis demolitor TaxID=69319 RepID=UPI00235B60EE|nr:uncharacterized protein LOC128667480 [Microplitis demolitor]
METGLADTTTMTSDSSNPSEESDEEKLMDEMDNFYKEITSMESDEDTFTLRVSEDSGVEENLDDSFAVKNTGESKEAESCEISGRLGRKSDRILSDDYYDGNDDDDDDDDTERPDQNRQALVVDTQITDREIQNNYVESMSEKVAAENDGQGHNETRDIYLESLNDFSQNNNQQEDNVDLSSTEKPREMSQDTSDDDQVNVGEKNINLIEKQSDSMPSEPVENFDLEDGELVTSHERRQCQSKQVDVNSDLEEGEIDENVEVGFQSLRHEREGSAELIEVRNEVNDRLFGIDVSDNSSDECTIVYSDHDSCYKYGTESVCSAENFSTSNDDPWELIASPSNDCVIIDDFVIVDEIESLPKSNDNNKRASDRKDKTEKNEDGKKKSKKRRLSNSPIDCNYFTEAEDESRSCENVSVDYNDLVGICSKEEVAELADNEADNDYEPKKKKSYAGREHNHPLFRDIDVELCERLMRVKKQGTIIIRPSSKGPDYLKITWKVTDDIYQHIKIKKKLRSSEAVRYCVGSKDFVDIDEVVNKYVKPMADNARKLLEFKHYKSAVNGVKATAEKLLTAEKEKNPNGIPYIVTAVKRSPGKFLISYLPRVTCYHEYIKITPEGFCFRDQPFDNLNELFIYFKANSKEVKNVSLKDETVTSTTATPHPHPRPLTPRSQTPRPSTLRAESPEIDMTPRILEAIQDIPDEKLESIRLILERFTQPTLDPASAAAAVAAYSHNPAPFFNQNPAPVPRPPPPTVYNNFPPYQPVYYPTINYSAYPSAFRPYLPNVHYNPQPVPYPPERNHGENLPAPPGTN